MLSVFLPPAESDVSALVAQRLRSVICQSHLGSLVFAVAGAYTVQLAWAQWQEGDRPPGGLSHCPPGVAPDRLETSGHIWEGSADGGVRVGLAVREQSCSRAASQNSLFTAKIQTRRKTSAHGFLLLLLRFLRSATFVPFKVNHFKFPYELMEVNRDLSAAALNPLTCSKEE